tara:strand:+ start:309 stop:515 length:207 start_codon:yes stop_codon:yes gene_type:complete
MLQQTPLRVMHQQAMLQQVTLRVMHQPMPHQVMRRLVKVRHLKVKLLQKARIPPQKKVPSRLKLKVKV